MSAIIDGRFLKLSIKMARNERPIALFVSNPTLTRAADATSNLLCHLKVIFVCWWYSDLSDARDASGGRANGR